MPSSPPSHQRSLAYLAMAAVLAVLHACSARQPAATATTAPDAPPPAVRIVVGEPPATSELALMMREMATFADSTAKRLLEDRDLPPYPDRFKGLKTAGSTPGMVQKNTFDPYADAWLHHLDRLYAVASDERVEVYNDLVSTCAACHTTMCPGPLVRINKMKLPEGDN